MALTPHESGEHHVGLGERGGTLYGFQVQGGYTRQMQREGSRSVEVGGNLDLTTAAIGQSRWTQDEFIGGAYQTRATKDKAAFATCLNLIPQLQGVGAISIPPMIQHKAFNPLAAAYTSHLAVAVPSYVEPKNMFSVAGSLYIVFKHVIIRWRQDTDALSSSNVNQPTMGDNLEIADAAYDQGEEMYWALLSAESDVERFVLRRFRHDFTDPNVGTEIYQGPPDTEGMVGYGLSLDGPGKGEVVVSAGQRLFTFLPPKQPSDQPTAGTWTDRGRLPGRWKHAVAFNNRLYILCNEADGETHIVTWDGNEILPVTTFPFNFEGWEMRPYGGRLFIVGRGTDVNGGDRYGELYELTGASIRLVRSFMPEHVEEYAVSTPKNFKTLAVADGLLWFPHQGRGLIAYDLTADGFWGASEFQSPASSNFTIHALCHGRASLYGYGSQNGTMTGAGLYRVAINTESPAAYSCVLETADLDYEIGRKKRWSEIVIRCRNQTTGTVEYSPDSGYTWTPLTATPTTVNDITTFRASLAAIPPGETIRFRFTFPQGTDTSVEVMELIAFTVTFIVADTGKSAWSLSLLGVDQVEDWIGQQEADLGDNRVQDVASMFGTVRGWAMNKTPLTFKDVDGAEYDVHVVDYSEYLPEIGPRLSDDARPEGFIRLSLQEV